MSSPDNELSYSAYADEAHQRYIENAREQRVDRRSIRYDNDDSSSYTDTTNGTDTTNTSRSADSDDRIGDSDSSDLSVEIVGDSRPNNGRTNGRSTHFADPTHSERVTTSDGMAREREPKSVRSMVHSVLHVNDLCVDDIQRAKSTSPTATQITCDGDAVDASVTGSGPGGISVSGLSGRARVGRYVDRGCRMNVPKYQSDITSDDKVLLREFGDSENTTTRRKTDGKADRSIRIDGRTVATGTTGTIDGASGVTTPCFDDPLGALAQKKQTQDLEALLLQDMAEVEAEAEAEAQAEADSDSIKVIRTKRDQHVGQTRTVGVKSDDRLRMELEIAELERMAEVRLSESEFTDSTESDADNLLATLEDELCASLFVGQDKVGESGKAGKSEVDAPGIVIDATTSSSKDKARKKRSKKRRSRTERMSPIDHSQNVLPNPRKGTGGSRRMTKWANDEKVDRCYGCNGEFDMIRRKHHCRQCGRIFCHECSRYTTRLPRVLLRTIPDQPDTYIDYIFGKERSVDEQVRVCGDCYRYVSDIIRVEKLIRIFELCGFNIVELYHLATINDNYKIAADFCVDKFTEIQYKLSIENLTPIEKKYIWINRHLLSKHSRWMVLLFKSCDMSDPHHVEELKRVVKSKRRVDCMSIKCSRFCSESIQLGDMLDLVRFNTNNPLISEYVAQCVAYIDNELLMDYLPFLVTNAVNNQFMIDILLVKAREDFSFMAHIYWCIKVFVNDLNVRRTSIAQALRFIKMRCSPEFTNRFKVMIKNERMDVKWIETQNVESMGNIVVPVCPDHDFNSIDTAGIKVMDSFSKPVIIPFVKDRKKKLIMYKEDDIRKDYVILGIINIIHRMLNEELGLNIDTVKYRVMPTSKDTGYIEIVENAETIYDIVQSETIQNYILNHNQHMTVSMIKDRFIKSTALYCVISYLFGFGDRHLENIMISESGLLFHIDFGYILGQDPKYTNNKSLRVTPEIINVIGGKNTDNYAKFSECCTQIYTCLRRHVNLFSNLLSVVPLIDPSITDDRVKHELFDRFEVGENNLEAATHMDLKVRRDSGSFDYMVIDFLHRSKNTTLFKGLRYVTGFFSSAYSNGST